MKLYLSLARITIVISALIISLTAVPTKVSVFAQSASGDLYAPEIVVVSPRKGEITTSQSSIVFEGVVLSYKLPLTEVAFYVNGGIVFRTKVGLDSQNRFPFRVAVDLQPGENVIKIIASSQKSPAAFISDRIIYNPSAGTQKSRLAVLALGISSYADKSLNLANADAEVNVFAKKMSETNDCIFAQPETRVLTGAEATRNGILSSLSWLNKQSQSESDVRILFIRGHVNRDGFDNYYLLSSDHTSDAELDLNDINFELIWRRLQSAPGPVVVLIDADLTGRYENSPWLMRAVRPAGNVTVIANSNVNEIFDGSGVGPFTGALLEGLTGKADSSKDGVTDADELQNWLNERLPKITKNRQQPSFWRDANRKPTALYCAR